MATLALSPLFMCRHAEALPLCERSVAALEAALGPSNANVASALMLQVHCVRPCSPGHGRHAVPPFPQVLVCRPCGMFSMQYHRSCSCGSHQPIGS